MKTAKYWMVLVVLVVSGCTTEIQRLREDIARLDRSQDELRRRQADVSNDMASVNESLRTLAGRVEELEYQQRARVGTDISSLREELGALKKRVPPPAIVPVEALEADEALGNRLATGGQNALASVLQQIRTGNFSAALDSVDQSIAADVSDDLKARLLFWKGVALDGMSDSRKAIVAYNELVAAFPRHERTSLALWRLASLFVRLGDSNTAKLTLEKLVKDFPKTPEAAFARNRIKELK